MFEDSGVVGRDAVSLGEWFLTFRHIPVNPQQHRCENLNSRMQHVSYGRHKGPHWHMLKVKVTVISGFPRDVDEMCALLEYYAV